MSAVIGWIALFLVAYITIALFFTAGGAKKALRIASASGEFQSEAKAVLSQSHRARLLWVRRHMAQLPMEARSIAARVVAIDSGRLLARVIGIR